MSSSNAGSSSSSGGGVEREKEKEREKEGGSGSGDFNGWLQRVRASGDFSDITVVVQGREFRLHTLPLLNSCRFFRDMNSHGHGHGQSQSQSKSVDDDDGDERAWPCLPRVVRLPDTAGVSAEAFSAAADFCYMIKPRYTFHNVAAVRAAAQYLGMPALMEDSRKYVYGNVLSCWRSALAFLDKYERLGVAVVDDYLESRCVLTLVNSLTKALVDTRQISAPLSSLQLQLHLPLPLPLNTASSSPSTTTALASVNAERLALKLAAIARLPDRYIQNVIDSLVKCHLNLNIKCRQGRYVKEWTDHLLNELCKTIRSRFWMIVCLSRMLQKTCSSERPWLELSSRYWCTLLEHADILSESGTLDEELQEKLNDIKAFLEYKIGGSLDELDWYLTSYTFSPRTLLSLVSHFRDKDIDEKEKEEVCKEVDCCLWSFTECGSISSSEFVSLYESFPESFRQNHDSLYKAIERLVDKHGLDIDEAQELWNLVDLSKLSSSVYDKALKNPVFLCQPQVLETVLQRYSQELELIGDGEENSNRGRVRQNLTQIMHKVIKASLKLLEENSRRSMEIVELQKQYAALLQERMSAPRESFESSPETFVSGCSEPIRDMHECQKATSSGLDNNNNT